MSTVSRRERASDDLRRAVVHDRLLLVRASSAAQLDGLLQRAELRKALLRRLGPTECLFTRDVLRALRKRLDRSATPYHSNELPSRTAPPGAGA